MRAILLGDIIAAARALMPLADDHRAALLATMLQQSHAAHLFHKRKLRPHPDWGNGSLMARANLHPQMPEPYAFDISYLQSLQLVIAAICQRRTGLHAR